MKKLLLKISMIAALAVSGLSNTNAQVYEQGKGQLNVGLGIGSTLTATGFNTTIPPIGVSYEYGFHENISGGAYLGYSGADYEFAGYKWTYSYIIVGARGSWHFDFLDSDKLDPYAGLLLGYNIASVSVEKPAGATYTPPVATAGGVVIGGHLGMRYHFNEKLGAFAELGYGIAFLQLGVTAKF
ncbi:MAG: outer membrane beta-barrel protein [Bacteroidota bacterium]